MKRTLAGIAACLLVFTACSQGAANISFDTQVADTSPIETSVSYITDSAEEWLNAHTTAPIPTETEISETEPEISENDMVLEAVKTGLYALGKKDREGLYNAVDMDVLYYSEYGDAANKVTDDIVSALGLDTTEDYQITDVSPISAEQYSDMLAFLENSSVQNEENTITTVTNETFSESDSSTDVVTSAETMEGSEMLSETSTVPETGVSDNSIPSTETVEDEGEETVVSETENTEYSLPDFTALKERFGISDVYCVTVTTTMQKQVDTSMPDASTVIFGSESEEESSDFQADTTGEITASVSDTETSADDVAAETEVTSVVDDGNETEVPAESETTASLEETTPKYVDITITRKFYVFKIADVWKLDVLYSYAYNESVFETFASVNDIVDEHDVTTVETTVPDSVENEQENDEITEIEASKSETSAP